jgi:transcriptional regulator with XRE-family HTH domain
MEIKLRNIRTSKGLTLKEVADISGVSKSQISDFETGTHDITVNKLCKISKALGCTLNDLIDC